MINFRIGIAESKVCLFQSSLWRGCTSLCMHAKLFQSLCNLMNCSPPGSSVHGSLQASILEWAAIPFSRGSSRLRNGTLVYCIADRFLLSEWLGKPIPIYIPPLMIYETAHFSTPFTTQHTLKPFLRFLWVKMISCSFYLLFFFDFYYKKFQHMKQQRK